MDSYYHEKIFCEGDDSRRPYCYVGDKHTTDMCYKTHSNEKTHTNN